MAALSAFPLAEARGAATTGPPRIVLSFLQCDTMLENEARRIAGIELRNTPRASANGLDETARVGITCGPSEIRLELASPDGDDSTRLARTLPLADVASSARPRLLALAIAELVVAGQEELRGPPAPAAPSPAAPSPAAPSPAAPSPAATPAAGASPAPRPAAHSPVPVTARPPDRPRRMALHAIGGVRAFPGSSLYLFGGGVRAHLRIHSSWTLALDLSAEAGAVSRAIGKVAVRDVAGAAGVGYSLHVANAVLMPWAGIRGGWAHLSGEGAPQIAGVSGTAQSGPWAGPELGVTALLYPDAPVHALVSLSAGAALLGVRGQVSGEESVTLLGPWAGVVIGIGLAR